MKFALAWIALVAAVGCRERGTLRIDLEGLPASCRGDGLAVTARLVPRGSCAGCGCNATCPMCGTEPCPEVCGAAGCPIEDVREHGLVFDPPASGQYAAVYKFFRPRDGGLPEEVAVVCAEVVVEDDTTESMTVTPAYAACCESAGSADSY